MNGCLYDKRNDYDQAFSVTRGDSVILSTKKELFDEYDRSEGFSYSLIILTSNLKEVYRIDSDNLFDTDDGTTVYYSEDKSSCCLACFGWRSVVRERLTAYWIV